MTRIMRLIDALTLPPDRCEAAQVLGTGDSVEMLHFYETHMGEDVTNEYGVFLERLYKHLEGTGIDPADVDGIIF